MLSRDEQMEMQSLLVRMLKGFVGLRPKQQELFAAAVESASRTNELVDAMKRESVPEGAV